jgi:hypothetical protein
LIALLRSRSCNFGGIGRNRELKDHTKVLALIESCENPEKLRMWITNARKKGEASVADAAFRRLIALLPKEKPGTVEHDFWQTIFAFEYALSEERGRTTRLARTRQKVARVGEIQTLRDWALRNRECTVLGAAILGAVGSGYFADIDEAVKAMVAIDHTIDPDGQTTNVYQDLFQVFRHAYEASGAVGRLSGNLPIPAALRLSTVAGQRR